VNLDVLRTHRRVLHTLTGGRRTPQRTPRQAPERLRVGVLANLSSTLIVVRSFFEQAPDHVDLFVFDVAGADAIPGYLTTGAAGYASFDADDVERIAAAIEAADLDILLADVYKADAYAVFDRITTPCVVDFGGTVQFVFHDAVAYRYYYLAQADYLVRDGLLRSTAARAPVSRIPVYEAPQLFEERGLGNPSPRPWREREPLVVYHGKLYKATTPEYLDAVLGLLAEDDELELVLLGRDGGGALGRIEAAAQRAGIADRVHYEGQFFVRRNEAGEIDDPSWLRLADVLGRARLAPDPWPVAGGCARVEAYLAGAPVAHMGIRTDRGAWGRPQPALTAEHPAVVVERGTAYDVAGYRALCRRLLSDEAFADELAADQRALAAQLVDARRWWTHFLECYADWLGAR
jgi:hypothetical protein